MFSRRFLDLQVAGLNRGGVTFRGVTTVSKLSTRIYSDQLCLSPFHPNVCSYMKANLHVYSPEVALEQPFR